MRSRFRLGTVSAGAAFFSIGFMMLFSGMFFYAVLAMVYSVPCVAAYKKSPSRFWQPFTLFSVFGTIFVTYYLTHAFMREIDGRQVVGFPLPIEQSPDFGTQAFVSPNALLVSGLCLFPLALLSTLDTCRGKRNRQG